MLAGLNGELILFEFMLGFILHPNLPRLFVRPHFVFEGVWAADEAALPGLEALTGEVDKDEAAAEV